MARDQVLRWSMDHPSCPKTGHYFEVPLSYTVPRVAAVIGIAGIAWLALPRLLWYKKPESVVNPEFIAEAKAIGAVAVGLTAHRLDSLNIEHHCRSLIRNPSFAATNERATCVPQSLHKSHPWQRWGPRGSQEGMIYSTVKWIYYIIAYFKSYQASLLM